MLSWRINPNRLWSLKCQHVCFDFDLQNCCPTCREAGKGDGKCGIFQASIIDAFNKLLELQNYSLNGHPTPITTVNNSPEAVPQPSASQQPKTFEPTCLVFRIRQLQEKVFSVKVAEWIVAPQRPSTKTIYRLKCCREHFLDFSSPSVKQISDLLCTCSSTKIETIDGYWTALFSS